MTRTRELCPPLKMSVAVSTLTAVKTTADSIEPEELRIDSPRKHLRVGHVSERGGVNAVRALLEAYGHVVDEVDGRSDYGRDLIVDVTENGEITGAVVGMQVKGGRRFIRNGDWELPVSAKDRRYWAESSVPVVGILWNPENGEMRWTNLTEHARYDPRASAWRPTWLGTGDDEPYNPRIAFFPEYQVLNDDNIRRMVGLARAFVRLSSSLSLLGLFDSDGEQRLLSVMSCWAVGHTDHRALLLLRRMLPSLSGESFREALMILSLLTRGECSSFADEIKRQVIPTFRWSAQEIYDLVCRASTYCAPMCLLAQDPSLPYAVPVSIDLAMAQGDLNGAFRLWMLYRHPPACQIDPRIDILGRYPELNAHPGVQRELHKFDDHADELGLWGIVASREEYVPCCEECGSVLDG